MKFFHRRLIGSCSATTLALLLFASAVWTDIDLTKLPLEGGKISTQPMRGSVWPYQTETRGTRRSHGGEWIKTNAR